MRASSLALRIEGFVDRKAEAIREAIAYADASKELLAAEAEYERLSLALRGLGSDARPVPR